MTQSEIILAALSTGEKSVYSPVQVQKLFFLIDRNIGSNIGGPFFDFQPYNYGPFDRMVYLQLDELKNQSLVDTLHNGSYREYRLTDLGVQQGKVKLESLPNAAIQYIDGLSKFVRSLSFTQLVSSIYEAYPDMKVNSVFTEVR